MAQRVGREALVVYHDGFTLKGQVHEKVGEIVWDKVSGKPFPILAGEFVLDDRVRSIRFSVGQVQKVTTRSTPPGADRRHSIRQLFPARTYWPTWSIPKAFPIGAMTGNGRPRIRTPTGKRSRNVPAASPSFTSQSVFVVTTKYPWTLNYFPQEFTPEWTPWRHLSMF